MLFPLVLFLFVGTSKSSFPSYKPFSPLQQVPEMENSLEPIELSNRRGLHTNQITDCNMKDLVKSVSFNELQDLVEALAAKKGISPFGILKILHKRMKVKEEIEESIITAMDGVPVPEVLIPPVMEIPPPIRLPPDVSRAPYSLPNNPVQPDDTKVVIIPVASQVPIQGRREPPFMIASGGPPVGKVNHMIPAVFPMLSPLKTNHFRPPLGVTVRVISGDSRSPLNRNVIIPLSPLMTILEALRQAEIKYQNILGLNHDMDVITFVHVASLDCFMIDSIHGLEKSERMGWKILITDRDGLVVYDDFCLPNGKENLVKPGTAICLSYVPL